MPRTSARSTFGSNVDRLTKMIHMLSFTLENYSKMVTSLLKNPTVGQQELIKKLDELDETSRAIDSTSALLFQWQAVMLVTFTEAYLQDVLSEAAGLDVGLIKDAKLSATYDEIASASSLESLTSDLRRRWASRNFVDSGPSKWIERLRQMGAQNLDVGLAPAMEQLWGIRHLLVHNAGVVNEEFARIHKDMNPVVGSSITLASDQLVAFVETVVAFVNQTDDYFLKRFPGLSQSH